MRYLIATLGAVLCACATAAAAAPVPDALVLTHAGMLKSRPTADGAVLRELASGAELKPLAFANNPAGLWVYAQTAEGDFGWAHMSQMEGRGGLIPDAGTLLAWSAPGRGPAYCMRGKDGAASILGGTP